MTRYLYPVKTVHFLNLTVPFQKSIKFGITEVRLSCLPENLDRYTPQCTCRRKPQLGWYQFGFSSYLYFLYGKHGIKMPHGSFSFGKVVVSND